MSSKWLELLESVRLHFLTFMNRKEGVGGEEVKSL